MAWSVVVDPKLCEGNAVCEAVSSDVFRLETDDLITVLQDRPSDALREQVEQAVALCPRGAISIVED